MVLVKVFEVWVVDLICCVHLLVVGLRLCDRRVVGLCLRLLVRYCGLTVS